MVQKFFDAKTTDNESIADSGDYNLEHFICKNEKGETVSLIIVIKSDERPLKDEAIDFTKYKDNIIARKKGTFTDKEITDSVNYFNNKYLISPVEGTPRT